MALFDALRVIAIILSILKLNNGKEETGWISHKLISKDGWSSKTEQFVNPMFVYALCEDEQINSKRECIIVKHEDVHNDTAKPKQCTFTLKNASLGIIKIDNFGSDRAIFVWGHEAKKNKTLQWTFRMAVIQMSSCKVMDTELVVTTKTSAYGDQIWYSLHNDVIVYEDTFDVMIQGVKACGNAVDDSNCIYTYNSEGKLIGGPVTRVSQNCNGEEIDQLRPILRGSADKGYLLIGGQKSLTVSILKPTGKFNDEVNIKMLWKFPMNEKGHSKSVFHSNNDLIGMCSCKVLSDKLSCVCLQFDQEGNSKRQMKISVRKPSDATPIVNFLHNLRGGGFFFTTFYTDEKKYFYSMTKISADGQVIGEPIVIGSHERSCNPEFGRTRIIEEIDEQYCVILACNEKNTAEKSFKTFTKCYTSSSLDWKFHAKDRVEL